MSFKQDGVATPRLAAAVILVRAGDSGEQFELLLAKRNENSKFMGGFWVFPGGSVDPEDGEGLEGLPTAATREAAEEVGIEIPSSVDLVRYDHWITPEALPKRFDTHFFLAEIPRSIEATCDGSECVDVCWLTPAAALEAIEAEGFQVAFPTVKQLEKLNQFTTIPDLLEHVSTNKIVPIQPRVVGLPDNPQVLMPGEPGFE